MSTLSRLSEKTNSFCFVSLFFILTFLSANTIAQDYPWPDLGQPMIIEAGKPGTINEVINGDTTETGDRKHHHYILRRGEVYVFTEPIRTNGWPLMITAGYGSGTLPVIKASGPKPGENEAEGIFHVEGDLYLKGVTINGYDQLGNYVDGPHIRIAADGITVVCKNVNFDYGRSKSISIHNQNCSLFVEDCIFGNHGSPVNRHRSEVLLIRRSNSKVLSFKNNIFYNIEHLIARKFGDLNGYDKLVFEHNTIVNTGSGGSEFGAPDTLIYKNNLHVNVGIISEFNNRVDDRFQNTYMEQFRPIPYYFSIDSNNFFEPEYIDFSYNHYYLDPAISSLLPESSTKSTDKLFSKYLWNIIKDEPGNVVHDQKFEFNYFPTSNAEYEAYVSDFYNLAHEPVELPLYDTNFRSLDFGYSPDHPAYTSDSQGKPVGKLPYAYSNPETEIFSPVHYCQGDSAEPLVAIGDNIKWYTEKGGDFSTVAPTPETGEVDTTFYYVTFTENEIESEPDSIMVIVHPVPAPPAIQDTITQHNGSPLVINDEGLNLTWYENGDLKGNPVNNTLSLNEVGEYTYYVTQTISGCESTADTVNITLNPAPPVVQDSMRVCFLDYTYIKIKVTGKNLTWYHDKNSVLYGDSKYLPNPHTVSGSSVISELYKAPPAGKHTYLVTQTVNDVESIPDTLVIDVIPPPNPPIANDTTISAEVDPILFASGSNILWYPDTIYYDELSTPGNHFKPNVSGVGIYDFFVKQTVNGCASKADTVYLTIIPAPPLVNDMHMCEGEGAAQLQAQGENIKWYADEDRSSLLYEGNHFNTGKDHPGVYTYYATQTVSGLESLANPVNLRIELNPDEPIISDKIACDGELVSLNAGNGFDSYLWNTGETTQTISVTSSGTYKVTITKNGCNNSTTANVTVHSLPEVNVDSPIEACEGETLSLDAGAGFDAYQWSTGSTSPSIDVTSSGTYSVTVTEGICSNSASTQVTFHALPQITMEGTTEACEGETLSLDAGAGFDAYQWSTGSTSPSIDVTSSGIYSVTVTDGICNNSASTQVTFHALPQITMEGTTEACDGETLSLDAGAGFDAYEWSTGSTSQSIDVTSSGTYSVTVTEGICSNSASTDINFQALPQIAIEGATEACEGETISLDAGAGYDEYHWHTGSTSQIIDVTSSGRYAVTVTEEICSNSASIDVHFQELPAVELNASFSACEGEVVQLDAGVGFDNYNWSNGETNQVIQVDQSGKYTVELLKDACSLSAETNVTFIPVPEVNIGGPYTINENDTLKLNAGNGFTNYKWNNGSDERLITLQSLDLGEHLYWVQVTNTQNCTNSDSTIINVVKATDIHFHSVSKSDILVYPNPSDGVIYVQIENTGNSLKRVTISDMSGRVLRIITNHQPSDGIELNNFDPGMYMITLTFENKENISRQFIINNN